MKRLLVGMCALSLALTCVESASAQISCGAISTNTDMWQTQVSPGPKVRSMSTTSRDITLCGIWEVRAEGWISGYGGAAANNAVYYAQTDIELGVNPGSVGANGRHWIIWFTGAWQSFGQTYNQQQVQGPPPICTLDPGTCDGGGWVDYDECVCKYSPIVIDMESNGYALTSASNGVMFDLDADGVPERTAWTAPASDDGFLAIDRNGNGKIDNGSELFGNSSRVYQDLARPTAANGFEALNFMQNPSYGASVSDGKIDAADAVFGRLLVWTDRNHNGVSEPDELASAAGAGIVSISTTYKEKKRRDEFGNRFKQRGTVVLVDANGKQKNRHIFDIWFATQ